MADKQGFRPHHQVSRHTMVLRKAKENDAKRLELEESAEDAGATPVTRVTEVIRPPKQPTRKLPGDGAGEAAAAEPAASTSTDGSKRVSGRTVVIRHEGDVVQSSSRLSGRKTTVRVTGGDTIIRYESGDMVIKRGARRAALRKQIIWAYALGYLALFALFGYFLLTGTTTMTPEEFIERAFSKREGETIEALERAAYEAMRGNRTPAEFRVAQALSFYDENKETIHVESGSRLTLLTAAKFGKAILEDEKLDPARRTLNKPIRMYKETYLANMNWPFWLSLYNCIGFFLLLLLFLWRPIRDYLGTQGKKTNVAIRNARQAQDTAMEIRNRYRHLAADIEARGGKLRWEAETQTAEEREAALDKARKQAENITESIHNALDLEGRKLYGQLGAGAAREACEQARAILEKRLGQKEHDAAIDELIADINAAQELGA